MKTISKILLAIIALGLIALMFTGCLYTKNTAKAKFGCVTDSIRVDSFTQVNIDTFWKPFLLPKDTIFLQSPCAEIAKMKPGESKIVKGKRTTSEYGKDSAGKSFFKCEADAYKDSMQWYKQYWYTTVTNTVFQHQPTDEFSWWQWLKEGWGIIALLLVIIGIFILLKR